MFDKAQKEIFQLCARDSFQRFKKTKLFTKWLDTRKKAELGKRFFMSPTNASAGSSPGASAAAGVAGAGGAADEPRRVRPTISEARGEAWRMK
jgi:hypothetical protein